MQNLHNWASHLSANHEATYVKFKILHIPLKMSLLVSCGTQNKHRLEQESTRTNNHS
jgi:hypothetical protein